MVFTSSLSQGTPGLLHTPGMSSEFSLGDLKARNEAAWAEAFRSLWPCAFHAAQHPRVALTPAEAEDIACEALEELPDAVDRMKTARHPDLMDDLKPLIISIAYRRAISFARMKSADKRGRGQVMSLDALQEASAPVEPPTLDEWDDTGRAELIGLLDEALRRLEEPARGLLMDHLLRGLSYKELCGNYGLPMGTVSATLSRGLRKVREHLENLPRLREELRGFLR